MSLVRALLVLVLLGAEAQAAEADQPVRHHLTLYGKQMPLPSGDWLVAGTAPTNKDIANQPLPAPVVTLVLFRVDGGAVTAFITVHTNILPARRGWGAAGACHRSDLYVAALDTNADDGVSCSFAAPVSVLAPVAPEELPSGLPSSPAWQSARALAAERGWQLPETWLMAGARVGDREDFVDIRYHFDPRRWGWSAPAFDGAPDGNTNPWAPAVVKRDPPRAHLVEALIRWQLAMVSAVELGLKNRLEDDFALSWPRTAAGGTGRGIDERKEALDALLAEGRLSPAQYQEQLRLAAESETDAADDDALWMIGAKTVGWRIVVASSVAVFSYAFTSSAAIAGGIAVTNAVVNGALYFGHELFWKKLDPTATPSSPQIIDFAGAGITG